MTLAGVVALAGLAIVAIALLAPVAARYTVCPSGCRYSTIQAAIDAAQPGETILVGPDEYFERLVISKPLVLEAGADPSRPRSTVMTRGAVIIASDEPIRVEIVGIRIDGMRVSQRRSACTGEEATCGYGMVVGGRARVALKEVHLVNHAETGLWVRDTAEVALDDSLLEDVPTGVRVTDAARLTGLRASIRAFGLRGQRHAALAAAGRARVSFVQARIVNGAEAGLDACGEAEVELQSSHISVFLVDGPRHAVVVDERASVALRHTWLEGNHAKQTGTWCHQQALEAQICTGILLAGEARLTLFKANITDQVDWGLAARLRRCGFGEDRFTGRVIVEGPVMFKDNNSSGSVAGQGNPGQHPWRADNLADGQVCLP